MLLSKISAVWLLCCDKFEETLNDKVVNMSKLTKSYFNAQVENFFLTVHMSGGANFKAIQDNYSFQNQNSNV